MSRWTAEQEAAILARGASVVVSAAAGSGKTSVLVERLIRMLSDHEHPTPAERVVVVTFTNDAAAEVSQRLDRALSQKLEQSPEDVWLRRQQTMLQSAKISTIHSFCFDLIREQFAQLQIAAGFRIMEDTEEKHLRSEIADAVLEQLHSDAVHGISEAQSDRRLLLDAFCDQDDSGLEALLLPLYRCTESVPFGTELLLQAADKANSGDLLSTALSLLEQALTEIHMLYQKALEHANLVGQPKMIAVISDEDFFAEKALAAIRRKELNTVADHLGSVVYGTIPGPGKQYAEPADARAAAIALRTLAKEKLKALSLWVLPLRYAEADLPRHGSLLAALYRLLLRFDSLLMEAKLARNAIGFSDAMRLALRLLATRNADGTIQKTPLAEQLSQQYDLIMIDEFQDADNQQDLIFRMLSRGGSAEHYGENLFVVGDSKQCIYRFRSANPENFMRAMSESIPYQTPQLDQNSCIHLNRNFRSASTVVDCVNHIFHTMMSRSIGEIDYGKEEALVLGADYPEQPRPVELLMLEEVNRNAHEPEAVAARIAWHLQQGTPVKDRDGSLRPCRPGDFLILLRTATQMPRYAAALQQQQIPVGAVETEGYLESPEITLLLEILRAVDNPLLDVSMASAMLSPMIGFSLNDLVAIRLADRKGSLFQAMRSITAESQAYDAALTKQCEEFLQFLESMRLFAAMETPEQLIRRVYHQTDFLGMMQLSGGSDQKKANLRALLSHARQFESNRGGGLSAFLRYLDGILARGSDLESGGVLAGTNDVVSIKTIHKSKGLEAPFVILAHSERLFSSKDREADFQFHTAAGFGFRLHDPEHYTCDTTLPYETIAAINRKESISEEMRLLYVALTRAREYLILPLSYTKKAAERASAYAAIQLAFGGQTDALSRSANSMRDWLLMALIRNPSCEKLRRILNVSLPSDPNQPLLSVRILTADELSIAENIAQDDSAADMEPIADPSLLETISTQCAWHYDSALANLTAKYGVSELAKPEDFSAPLRRPLFMRNQRGLTGAERGTALHTFLEYADFAAAAQDLSAEIERLTALGRITQRQAKAVAASNLAAFFSSPLYARIAAAKSVEREKKFTVRLADLHLQGVLAPIGAQYAGTDGLLIGIMDLVFEEDNGIVLVDYKTDRNVSDTDLLERYTEQLQLYAEALRLLTGQPVAECYLYSLSLQRAVSVPLYQ
ncbi:MAG: UvrD-helicase domain-containing protein [Oscillospiraceae bacterium]|nr:UvrD-helicase domain-containing protein [Oscillospiraceae bacterium]